jgi:hypothetical protein
MMGAGLWPGYGRQNVGKVVEWAACWVLSSENVLSPFCPLGSLDPGWERGELPLQRFTLGTMGSMHPWCRSTPDWASVNTSSSSSYCRLHGS